MRAFIDYGDGPPRAAPIRYKRSRRRFGALPRRLTDYMVRGPSGDWLRVWHGADGEAEFVVTTRGAVRPVQLIGRWKESDDNHTWAPRI